MGCVLQFEGRVTREIATKSPCASLQQLIVTRTGAAELLFHAFLPHPGGSNRAKLASIGAFDTNNDIFGKFCPPWPKIAVSAGFLRISVGAQVIS